MLKCTYITALLKFWVPSLRNDASYRATPLPLQSDYSSHAKLILLNLIFSMYLYIYTGSGSGTADTGGLSTDLTVTLGVGILTLAVIILVSCCTKKRRNNQIQGEPIMYSS